MGVPSFVMSYLILFHETFAPLLCAVGHPVANSLSSFMRIASRVHHSLIFISIPDIASVRSNLAPCPWFCPAVLLSVKRSSRRMYISAITAACHAKILGPMFHFFLISGNANNISLVLVKAVTISLSSLAEFSVSSTKSISMGIDFFQRSFAAGHSK